MIIMLNGAFGVGKSTTAALLQERLPGSMLFDPEMVGMMLRALTHGVRQAEEETGDFQDIRLWPTLTVEVARRLYAHYQRDLIVPMTLVHLPYFQTIRAGLAEVAPPLFHFALMASRATIHRRLLARGDEPGSWAAQQTVRCVEALAAPDFGEHLDTEQHDAPAIVALIMERIVSARR